MIWDIVVIGAGPAGLTAAIYARRAGLAVLTLEKNYAGGQITSTHLLENYPGFPQGVSGADFAALLSDQAKNFGAEIRSADVTRLSRLSRHWVVETSGEQLLTKTVILAAGAAAGRLGIPGEEKLTGAGVSYCATCDGAFFRDAHVVVIGGGDTAAEDALYLSKLAAKVTVVHRREGFRAQKILQDRMAARDNIEIMTPYIPVEFTGEWECTGVRLRHRDTGEETLLQADGCFVAIGYRPDTAIVKDLVELSPAGAVVAGEDTHTSAPGLFAAGDIREKLLRQVVTAAADGAVAAEEAAKYIEDNFGG